MEPEERRKTIRRANDCPAEKCSMMENADKNIEKVAKRVTHLGSTFLVILGIVSTILIFMVRSSLSTQESTRDEVRSFISTHTEAMIANASLNSALATQFKQQEIINLNSLKLQEELLKKVTRLETRDELFHQKGKKDDFKDY